MYMARTKSTKSLFPPTEATVETQAPTADEVPFPSPSVRGREPVAAEDQTLTEEERQLNAIEARRTEIIGTVESKLKVALSDACAHLKLLTKLGIDGILARKDFADYRRALYIGKEFAESEVLPAATPKTRTPKAPRESGQKPSLTTIDAIDPGDGLERVERAAGFDLH